MTDSAIKKRQTRAKRRAIEHFRDLGYKIIESDNSAFCFIATCRAEVRFVRVVIDRITEHDIKLTQGYELPGGCSCEIFCQKETRFEIQEVRE